MNIIPLVMQLGVYIGLRNLIITVMMPLLMSKKLADGWAHYVLVDWSVRIHNKENMPEQNNSKLTRLVGKCMVCFVG